MAKQPEDNKMLDMLPAPKRRGRPSTGKALSAAERKAAQRDRDRDRVFGHDGLIQLSTTTGLLEQLGVAVKDGCPHIAEAISDELIRRATQNQ